jgi:hypothetical protein
MSEELAPGPEGPPAPPAGPREVWKKGGRLLSVLLAVNVLLLACTLISGGAFNKVAVYDTDVFALLTAMMLLAVLWILFYLLRTTRCPDAVPYHDAHAGPIWLRGAGGGGDRSGVGMVGSRQLGFLEDLQLKVWMDLLRGEVREGSLRGGMNSGAEDLTRNRRQHLLTI